MHIWGNSFSVDLERLRIFRSFLDTLLFHYLTFFLKSSNLDLKNNPLRNNDCCKQHHFHGKGCGPHMYVECTGSLKWHVSLSPTVSFTCSVFVNHSFFFFFRLSGFLSLSASYKAKYHEQTQPGPEREQIWPPCVVWDQRIGANRGVSPILIFSVLRTVLYGSLIFALCPAQARLAFSNHYWVVAWLMWAWRLAGF